MHPYTHVSQTSAHTHSDTCIMKNFLPGTFYDYIYGRYTGKLEKQMWFESMLNF